MNKKSSKVIEVGSQLIFADRVETLKSVYKDKKQMIGMIQNLRQNLEFKKGFAAEIWHSTTFNIDSKLNKSSYRAYTTDILHKLKQRGIEKADILSKSLNDYGTSLGRDWKNQTRNHSVVDIFVSSDKKVKQVYQAKYNIDPKLAVTRNFNKARYIGINKLAPSDNVSEIKRISNKLATKNPNSIYAKSHKDTYQRVTGKVSYKNINSKELTVKGSKELSSNTKQYVNENLILPTKRGIVVKGAMGGFVLGVGFSAALSMIKDVQKNKQIDYKKLYEDSIYFGAKGGMISGVGTALSFSTVLSKSSAAIPYILASSFVESGIAVYNFLDGKKSVQEFSKILAESAINTSVAICFTLFGVAVFGGLGGGLVGSIAGSILSDNIFSFNNYYKKQAEFQDLKCKELDFEISRIRENRTQFNNEVSFKIKKLVDVNRINVSKVERHILNNNYAQAYCELLLISDKLNFGLEHSSLEDLAADIFD